MSDLQPKGAVLSFNGEERHLYWDYGVIEKVQEQYGVHPFTAIQKIFGSETTDDGKEVNHYQAKPVLDIIHILLNNEVAREKYFNSTGKSALRTYTRPELGILIDRNNAGQIVKAIIESWKESAYQDDDDDDEEDEKNVKSE